MSSKNVAEHRLTQILSRALMPVRRPSREADGVTLLLRLVVRGDG